MSDSRYSVIFTGKIKPELSVDTVTSNLVLDIGLEQQKAAHLLGQTRVVLKRCDAITDAQRLAEKFDRAGAICIIEDRFTRDGAPVQSANGESSLVKIINKFIPSARQSGATPVSRK